MRDGRSSRRDPLKLTNFHIVVSSFAAIAGVTLAGYQTFAPKSESAQQVQVTVALDPLTYQREIVEVVIDDGRIVKLSRGPKVGTQVVTTGANQVWGAELGVGH